MKLELSAKALRYFQAQGRIGGSCGDHAKKGFGGDRLRARLVAEINRTRRVATLHAEGCGCQYCRRYWAAKEGLDLAGKAGSGR